jgi:HSP20 family molecular chaperone IbpA
MSLVHRNGNDQALTMPEPDPFWRMWDMLTWNPFQSQAPIPSWPEPRWEDPFVPVFEVAETKDRFQFKSDLPGMKESAAIETDDKAKV